MMSNIKKTFGYQLARRRVEKDLTEKALAEKVNNLHANKERVSADDIRDWENPTSTVNKAILPSEQIVETLAVILIDRNPTIPEERKILAREAFIEAAERNRNEKKKSGVPYKGMTKPLFADLLREHRMAMNLTEAELAKKSRELDQIRIVHKEDILQFQFGIKTPDFNTARYFATALELNDTKRKDFYKARDKAIESARPVSL